MVGQPLLGGARGCGPRALADRVADEGRRQRAGARGGRFVVRGGLDGGAVQAAAPGVIGSSLFCF